MRNRIVEANFKWRQAQLMVDYSYKQLDLAVAKWVEVATVDAMWVLEGSVKDSLVRTKETGNIKNSPNINQFENNQT